MTTPDRDTAILDALATIREQLAAVVRAIDVKAAPQRRLLSRRQAAKMLGVDRKKLSTWVREGRVREIDLDGVPRIPLAEVERLELHGLPAEERRPRRRRAAASSGSKLTAAEIAAELAKF